MSDSASSTSTLNEALTLISSTTVVSVLYTFCLILYSLCARFLYSWLRGLDGKRQTVWTFIVASVVIICGTMDVILNNQFVRIVYVDYSSQPGGPLGHSAQSHVSTTLHILKPASLLAEILTLGVLLWRVWVIYSGTRFSILIIILPLLFYLGSVATNILHLAFVWNPPSSAWSTVARTLQIPSVVTLSLTVISKIMMTSMVITRLLLIRRRHIELMGKTDIAAQYLGIAAMLIESYALTTAWNIGYLIAFILNNPPMNSFFGRSGAQVEILSYLLVLYRVFSGRAWSRQTQNQLSTLRWNRHSTQSTNDDSDMGVVTVHASHIATNPSIFTSR
ncbi:hypothetical protein Agabi119p4_1486 [Agaricus bisporus var. burnettii]|uniref:Uncharacterized protein n=1 Tax=Agaricus bisporus var. burnettii TaxID=192524 RepID=A0A8H7F7D9_AGABI|nr:hypothetical protein Agabi119p4_1486 [Agaricus bisporus var. burnettii]